MVQYDVAFRKPFTDWKKLVIGILLSILPVVRWFAKGFIFESSGVGKTKKSDEMPEWKDFGDLFVKGLLGTVISFIYMIPAVVVFWLGVGSTLIGLVKSYVGTVIPVSTLQGIAEGSVEAQTIIPTIMNNWTMAIPHLLRLTPILLLVVILVLVAKYLVPIAILNYIKAGEFGAAFKFREVFKKAFTGKYLAVWLVILIISVVGSWLLSWIPVVGGAAAWFFIGVFGYTLFGQVFKEIQ
jgi:hypothetical protein